MVDFQTGDARPQAVLHEAPFHEWPCPDGTPWLCFYRVEAGYLLRFPGFADFQLAQDGRQIRAWPAPGVSDATIQHLYLNQVLPLALNKQGKLVLHGSAVEIEGGGVAFIGESGLGKSTLAASFAASGFGFLTDDGLILEPDGEGSYQIMPSHPSIRLWSDSQAALIGPGVKPASPLPFTSKVRLLVGDGIVFCAQPRRLRRVYFLGNGIRQEPVFERMGLGETLTELVKHSFLLDIEERGLIAAHFDEISSMMEQPIFYRLDYPRHYESLPQVRQAIVDHAAYTKRETR